MIMPSPGAPTVNITLEGAGAELDREVLTEIVALRLFAQERFGAIQPGDLTASAGHCFAAAHLTALALSGLNPETWTDWEGYWLNDECLRHLEAGGTVRPSEMDEFAQSHGFVVSKDGLVVDITADQFGLAEVVITDNPSGRWYPYRPNAIYGGIEIERAEGWYSSWQADRNDFLQRAQALVDAYVLVPEVAKVSP